MHMTLHLLSHTHKRRDKAGESGDHPGDMSDLDVDKLIVVTSAKKGAKGQQLDQQLITDGLALYQEQLSNVSAKVHAEVQEECAVQCRRIKM